MKTRTRMMLTAASAALAMTASQAAAQSQIGGADMFGNKNIIENAVNSPIHTTLVAAVKAAGLVETLSGDGPFTVLAPMDSAFAALPEGTVEGLLEPDAKDTLTKILTCHVVAGDVMYGAVRALTVAGGGSAEIETLGGCVLTARMDGNRLTVTDENGTLARVVVPDVDQSNGVIHVIDAVILPASGEAMEKDGDTAMEMSDDKDETVSEEMSNEESSTETDMDKEMSEEESDEDTAMSDEMAEGMADEKPENMDQGDMTNNEDVGQKDEDSADASDGATEMSSSTVVDVAIGSPDHGTLVDAVIVAELADTLSGDGPFTVFAPTDAAFDALPQGTVTTLLMEENRDQLTEILTCHVVGADVMAEALTGMVEDAGGTAEVETLGGCMLKASIVDGKVMIEDEQGGVATVTAADLNASNGVVHVVDRVLLPAM